MAVLGPVTKGADYLSAIDFAEFRNPASAHRSADHDPDATPHARPDTNNISQCPGGRLRAFFKD